MLNTEESRVGAMACLNALRIIERIHSHNSDDTNLEFWRDKDATTTAMLQAAGVQSGFMAGFIAFFAEYAHMINTAGVPDLYKWEPESVLSEEDKAAMRAEFDAEVMEG